MARSDSVTLHSIARGGKYNELLMLTEYEGRVGLYQGNEGKHGGEFIRMCYPRTKEGPGEKFFPLGVLLGDNLDGAIRVLEQLLHVLKKTAEQRKGTR